MARFFLFFLGVFFSFNLFAVVSARDIKDIKPPVYFPRNYFLLSLIAVGIVLIAAAFLIMFLLKKYRDKKAELLFEPPVPAHQKAYEALRRLKKKNLPRIGKTKEYYFELSDIVRRYLEDRFYLRAPEMTTEEFLYALSESDDLNGTHKNLLKGFLNHCDLVKFAKYAPSQKETDESFFLAQKLIDETRGVSEKAKKEAWPR